MSGLLSAFAVVTLLFAGFYQKGIKMNNLYDTVDNLPPIPKNTKIIPRNEAIWGIGISVIFTIVFLCCPQIIFARFGKMGNNVAVFNIEYIRSTWYLIPIFSLLGIIRECVKLIDKVYTKRLMFVTFVTDILTAILSSIWITNKNIFNPDFLNAMINKFGSNDAFIGSDFIKINYMLLAFILFALLLDGATTTFRTIKK
ncbi:MAG: hypothetical protein ACERKZ_15195 [Lachnotalea sp.]